MVEIEVQMRELAEIVAQGIPKTLVRAGEEVRRQIVEAVLAGITAAVLKHHRPGLGTQGDGSGFTLIVGLQRAEEPPRNQILRFAGIDRGRIRLVPQDLRGDVVLIQTTRVPTRHLIGVHVLLRQPAAHHHVVVEEIRVVNVTAGLETHSFLKNIAIALACAIAHFLLVRLMLDDGFEFAANLLLFDQRPLPVPNGHLGSPTAIFRGWGPVAAGQHDQTKPQTQNLTQNPLTESCRSRARPHSVAWLIQQTVCFLALLPSVVPPSVQ